MSKETMTSGEFINEITEVLRNIDGEFIASIANQVPIPTITYDGDSLFTQEIED